MGARTGGVGLGLWGAVGLILAIPIMATVKVICDHSEGWEPVGRWLGA